MPFVMVCLFCDFKNGIKILFKHSIRFCLTPWGSNSLMLKVFCYDFSFYRLEKANLFVAVVLKESSSSSTFVSFLLKRFLCKRCYKVHPVLRLFCFLLKRFVEAILQSSSSSTFVLLLLERFVESMLQHKIGLDMH